MRRCHRDWALDLLLAHELATRSPAAAVMWSTVGQPPPPRPVLVERQAIRIDGRTTDLEAIAADGRALLCENKAAGGSYEFCQPESHATHCAGRQAWAITVAPRAFRDAGYSPVFDGMVAVQDLAAVLDEAAGRLDGVDPTSDELRRSYLHRAARLREYAQDLGDVGNPDEDVHALGDLHRRLLVP